MAEFGLGPVEMRFAQLIWDNEPLSSGRLVALAGESLQWKKSTTYTVLKKLCERGLFVNDNGTVRSLVSREGLLSDASESFVKKTFDGSLPAFVAAFTAKKKLSAKEIAELRAMIDNMEGK